MRFIEKADQINNHISIFSGKVKFNVTDSFGEKSRFPTFFVIFQKNHFQSDLISKRAIEFGELVGSASPSGGNQVDGLPPASSTGAVSASWNPKEC